MSKPLTRKFLPIVIAIASLVGCKANTTGLEPLELSQLTALLSSGDTAVLCDANTAETRERYGVIPGAILLSHYRDYEVSSELPANRAAKLVFYCHSSMCAAAGDAARVAVAAGYTDVAVYPSGILGWIDGNRPVEQPGPPQQEKS